MTDITTMILHAKPVQIHNGVFYCRRCKAKCGGWQKSCFSCGGTIGWGKHARYRKRNGLA